MYIPYNNYDLDKVFNAAIYCRLSKEDGEVLESESINNQKLLISKFVSDNNWNLVDFYIDDGFTGTNFERPDFKRLIDDIEKGIINLVVTKDLSRLGRDYIQTGYYLEKYFPLKNVRYIALNDGIDTFTDNSNNDMTPFKAVMNDMYSKDISKKVRSAILTKANNGECIKSFAPYGYKKHPTVKGKIIIDEETAPIVKSIFNMYYEGVNKSEIAKRLQSMGVPTPLKYKELTSTYKNPNSNNTYIWGVSTITKILRDRIYTGDLVQHKYSKLNYKSKKTIDVDIRNHIISENTHEAIVSKELYESVQLMLNKQSNEWNYTESGTSHLLRGLVRCGNCGASLVYSRNHGKYFWGMCASYKRFGKTYCSSAHLREDYLIDTVISNLKDTVTKYVRADNLTVQKNVQVDNSKIIAITNSKIKENNNYLKNLYKDKVSGVISEEMFLMLSKEYEEQKKKLEEQLKILTESSFSKKDDKELANLIQQVFNFDKDKIDRSLLLKLINRIEVNNKNEITVFYNFKQPSEAEA